MALFWAQGFDGTSVSQLSEATGLHAPSLYAAFGDKEGLFREALAHYGATRGGFVARALAEEPTARGAVARMLREAAGVLTRAGQPRGCMVVLASQTAGACSEALREALGGQRAANEQALEARLAQGLREGELPAGTDVGALARYFLSVFQGMSVQARGGMSRARLLEVAELALRAWPGR
jgi:AcrR family transcriptional regulator